MAYIVILGHINFLLLLKLSFARFWNDSRTTSRNSCAGGMITFEHPRIGAFRKKGLIITICFHIWVLM